MDDTEIISQTLNTMMNRHMKAVQNFEIEIANLIAEVARLQAQKEDLEKRLAETVKRDPKSAVDK
jgi:regulator of replication initiation timing